MKPYGFFYKSQKNVKCRNYNLHTYTIKKKISKKACAVIFARNSFGVTEHHNITFKI